MTTWTLLVCMHGVTEELDNFDCAKCRQICERKGCPCIAHNKSRGRGINKIRHLYGREPDDTGGE